MPCCRERARSRASPPPMVSSLARSYPLRACSLTRLVSMDDRNGRNGCAGPAADGPWREQQWNAAKVWMVGRRGALRETCCTGQIDDTHRMRLFVYVQIHIGRSRHASSCFSTSPKSSPTRPPSTSRPYRTREIGACCDIGVLIFLFVAGLDMHESGTGGVV